MENTIRNIESEIINWLETRGYYYGPIYVIDEVVAKCRPKISSKDLKDFKNEFNHEPDLKEVSFDKYGEKEYKYEFRHYKLIELGSKLNAWLIENEFPISYLSIGFTLYIGTSEKLSDVQINDLEKEFNVRYDRYSISCYSNDIDYEFQWAN